MSDIEKKSKKRARKQNLQNTVLAAVALAGILPVALVAPQVLVALKKLGLFPDRRQEESVSRARRRLIEKGLLKVESNSLLLTKAGEQKLAMLDQGVERIRKPRRWDHKWRLLIFDIPEKRRVTRNRVRESLLATGFIRVQDSVWLYPYDCEEYIALLKADFRIGRDLLYIIADSIEADARYRTHFNLPKEIH